jgi:hypothetical protein
MRVYDIEQRKMVSVKGLSIVLENYTAEEVIAALCSIAPPTVIPRRVNINVRRFKAGRRKIETVKSLAFEGRTPHELHDAIVAKFQEDADVRRHSDGDGSGGRVQPPPAGERSAEGAVPQDSEGGAGDGDGHHREQPAEPRQESGD